MYFQNIHALIFSKRNLQVFEDKILNIVRKTGRISSRAKTLNHSRRAENVQATPYWHKLLFTNEKYDTPKEPLLVCNCACSKQCIQRFSGCKMKHFAINTTRRHTNQMNKKQALTKFTVEPFAHMPKCHTFNPNLHYKVTFIYFSLLLNVM